MTWTSKEILLNNTEIAVGASETNTVISEVLRITGDPRYLLVKVRAPAADTTVTNAITVTLQTSSGVHATTGAHTWETSKTLSINDSSDNYYLRLLPDVSGDQSFLPLGPFIRLVITSGVSDTTDIESVVVSYDSKQG